MNEKIQSLVKVQEFDSQLEALAQTKAKLTPQREQIKADIQAIMSRAEEVKKALQQAQVDKKNFELDIETKEQAMRKNSTELNTVKSNEAYKALLTQIEDAKKAKSDIEDKILETMEKIDQLQKDLKEADKKNNEDKAVLEKKIQALDADEQRLQGEWDQKKKERDEFFNALPDAVRTPYQSVSRGGARKKPVVVAIKGNICGGCKTLLPPSVINEVMKGKDLISCETCTSILYIPPAQEGQGSPAGQPAAAS